MVVNTVKKINVSEHLGRKESYSGGRLFEQRTELQIEVSYVENRESTIKSENKVFRKVHLKRHDVF